MTCVVEYINFFKGKLMKNVQYWLVLLFFTFSAANTLACPDSSSVADEKTFNIALATYRGQLCWSPEASASANGRHINLMVYKVVPEGEHLIAELPFPIDVEGELREVKFDNANYQLNKNNPSFPVLVLARMHGVSSDQYTTDVMLFVLNDEKLKKVFETNVSFSSWATQCESDCMDTTNTTSIIIISTSKATHDLYDLKVRTKSKITPDLPRGKGSTSDEVTHYLYNGVEYVPQ